MCGAPASPLNSSLACRLRAGRRRKSSRTIPRCRPMPCVRSTGTQPTQYRKTPSTKCIARPAKCACWRTRMYLAWPSSLCAVSGTTTTSRHVRSGLRCTGTPPWASRQGRHLISAPCAYDARGGRSVDLRGIGRTGSFVGWDVLRLGAGPSAATSLAWT